MVKGIIFDCDGVIVDSEIIFDFAIRKMLKEYYHLDDRMDQSPDINGCTGLTVAQTIKDLYPEIKDSIEEVMKQYYLYTDAVLMSDDLKPMNGLIEFVQEMYASGVKLAVASSSHYDYVMHKLKLFNIDKYFCAIVSSNDISLSKPHPEIYLKAAEKLGLDKKDIIAIEDAPNGIKSAQSAGLYCVGFKGSQKIQDTSIANEEVHEFKEIKKIKENI